MASHAAAFWNALRRAQEAEAAALFAGDGSTPIDTWGPSDKPGRRAREFVSPCSGPRRRQDAGYAELTSPIPLNVADRPRDIQAYNPSDPSFGTASGTSS